MMVALVIILGVLVLIPLPAFAGLGEDLLLAGDLDASGEIDRHEELESISCLQWRQLDESSRARFGQPLWLVSGLSTNFPVYGGFPISMQLWEEAAIKLAECVIPNEAERLRVISRSVRPELYIEAIQADSLATWEEEVSRFLVARYGAPGQLRLENPAEVLAIPCEVWQIIERRYESAGETHLSVLNPEPDSQWNGGQLGISRRLRRSVLRQRSRCLDPA